jgi:hypothetical protein
MIALLIIAALGILGFLVFMVRMPALMNKTPEKPVVVRETAIIVAFPRRGRLSDMEV